MSKHFVCEDCHAIGVINKKEMLYNHLCPLCGGALLLVHPEDFVFLENRSDCVIVTRDQWNKDYMESRDRTTVVQYAGRFPQVRIIPDLQPCEACAHFGTYQPGHACKNRKTRMIGNPDHGGYRK